jgi:hypothetical protein
MVIPDTLRAAYEGAEIELPLAEAPPSLQRLAEIWNEKRGPDSLPPRALFSFEDVVPWLGYLHLLELVEDDFEFRIFGSAVAAWLGHDYTGRRLSEVLSQTPEVGAKAEVGYRKAIATAAPVYMHTELARHRGTDFGWSRLLLPLGEGDRITHLMIAIHYRP